MAKNKGNIFLLIFTDVISTTSPYSTISISSPFFRLISENSKPTTPATKALSGKIEVSIGKLMIYMLLFLVAL